MCHYDARLCIKISIPLQVCAAYLLDGLFEKSVTGHIIPNAHGECLTDVTSCTRTCFRGCTFTIPSVPFQLLFVT